MVGYVIGFMVLFVLSGMGNGSVFKTDPVDLRGAQSSLDLGEAERRHWSRAMSGSLIGFCSAVGALGGVGINLALTRVLPQQRHRNVRVLDVLGLLRRRRGPDLDDVCVADPVSAPGAAESASRSRTRESVMAVATRAMRQQLRGNAAETSQAYTVDMGQPDSAPLTGYRVAVTSARRAEELCALLRRQGAEVCSAPAINMIALPDDDELHSNTEALIAEPPDILVAHTGIGFRGWIAAAEGWGLADQLIESLSKARVVSRGPKATGALRAAGLHEEWSPKSESSQEVLEYLLKSDISGMRIAVQLHGAADAWDPFPEFLGGLRSAGADVVPIRVYRWEPTPLGGEFDQLVTGIARRQFDAVSFTSAPAAAAVLERSRELDIEDAAAGRAAHRRARDVRRPGDLPTVDPQGRPDIVARANAVGSLGPAYRRGVTGAGVVHGGRRPATWSTSAEPACWWTARSSRCRRRDGDIACAGTASRRRRHA